MTDRDLMQLVAGRSPAAARGALTALRAIAVNSPVVAHRVARVAETALADASVEWSPDERAALAEACAVASGDAPRDDQARARLSVLLTDSGLSAVALARVLGRDERTMRRWLSGEMAIPETAAEMIARIVRIDVTRDRVTVVLTR